MHATIDLESRNKIPISVGASQYANTAELMCLSYKIGEAEVKSWRPGQPLPRDLFDHVMSGGELHAHNATFEINMWNKVLVTQHSFPPVQLGQWRCTMAECYVAGLPGSLENAAKALELSVTKDMSGRRLMLKMCKPRKPTKHNSAVWHETPEQIQALCDYCDKDVLSEIAVSESISRLPPREQKIFQFDQIVNRRGVMIDRDLAESAVYLWDRHCEQLNQELSQITFGGVNSANEVASATDLIRSLGVNIPDMTKGVVEAFLEKEDLPPTVKRILEIRNQTSKSSTKKYHRMLACAESDDRIHGLSQYYGAHTGRWAGRLTQFQNLPRGTLKAKTEAEKTVLIESLVELVKQRSLDAVQLASPLPLGDLLSSLLRSCIIPAKGKRFLVCDFASVEARGLAWVAGEDWLLEAFKDGQDPYVLMASDIYGIKPEDVDGDQRFYGKTAVLGCGYQLGSRGLQSNLKNKFGIEKSAAFCEEIIKGYRRKNEEIKCFWYALGKAAMKAVNDGKPYKVGNLVMHTKRQGLHDWLCMRLPSGRDVRYFKPKLVPGDYGPQIEYTHADPKTGRPCRSRTYAGKLTENAIQAICRDLLVDAMSRLERAGYEVVFHVHDEVVLEVDNGVGSIAEVEEIMCEVPAWAEGFPIGAEGFECERYRK